VPTGHTKNIPQLQVIVVVVCAELSKS